MKRRTFLKKGLPLAAGSAVLAGCGGGSGSAPNVTTRPRIQWRMASSYPRSLDVLFGSAQHFCKRVAALTDGHFTIRPYPAGEIVPGTQVMDAVEQGTVQCGQTASYYYTGKNEALAFDTCMPFGMTARQQNAWFYHGGGLDLVQRIFADFNIISFPAGNTGAQMGGWFRREINSLADLHGLKMRIPGLGGEVMSRMQVTVQLISGGDLYLALERGAIDAVEWVGPYDDENLNFHKIINNYYYPGWWEPGPNVSHLIHKPSFEKLPAEYREAIEVACLETATRMLSLYDALNPEALIRLQAQGIQLKRFPAELMASAEKISRELLEEKAAADSTYRNIYDHWRAFQEKTNRWFALNEESMDEWLRAPYIPASNDRWGPARS